MLRLNQAKSFAVEVHMQGKSIGALVLIVLGVVFLAANHGWIPNIGHLFARWWPLILIIVGVSLLLRRSK